MMAQNEEVWLDALDDEEPLQEDYGDYGEFPLHKFVFDETNDVTSLRQFLNEKKDMDLNKQDIHGNTPLHLAVMLRRHELVEELIERQVTVKVKNKQGWTPMAEAVSCGHRETIKSLLRGLTRQMKEARKSKQGAVSKALRELQDFQMTLKWDFKTWIPFVSRLLPSDTCHIFKSGTKLRMDSTLVDFDGWKWERGKITFIFDGDAIFENSLVVLDRDKKVFQRIRLEESEREIDEDVEMLVGTDIVSTSLALENSGLKPKESMRWPFLSRTQKKERLGSFDVEYYELLLGVNTKKRREHLSVDDIKRNRALRKALLGQKHEEPLHRAESSESVDSLNGRKPFVSKPTWDEYINARPGEAPFLGRELDLKCASKYYRVTMGASEQFPLKIQQLVDVLEAVGLGKHFHRLKEFLEKQSLPGFPVKIEIPVFPTVTATVTFEEFKFVENSSDEFVIPSNFVEDPDRFPDM